MEGIQDKRKGFHRDMRDFWNRYDSFHNGGVVFRDEDRAFCGKNIYRILPIQDD